MADSTAVEALIVQSKNLRKVSKLKHDLESTLSQLTTCNNIAILAKSPKLFGTKVLKVAYKVMSNSIPSAPQIVTISVENVSEKFILNCENWSFCIRMNNGNSETKCTWNLEKSLGPGHQDRFCCPIQEISYNLPLLNISLSLEFAIEFESKTYSKSFQGQDSTIDILHCLDPGRLVCEQELGLDSFRKIDFSKCMEESQVLFPPITKVLLRVDTQLKKKFVKEMLLFDSLHRGFENDINELSEKLELTVYYSGCRIDISLNLKNDVVAIKCSNPGVLSAMKAAILRRLVTFPGINVETLDDSNKEKLQLLKYKLESFSGNNCDSSERNFDVGELMKLYLELRDISEMIRFSIGQDVEIVE